MFSFNTPTLNSIDQNGISPIKRDSLSSACFLRLSIDDSFSLTPPKTNRYSIKSTRSSGLRTKKKSLTKTLIAHDYFDRLLKAKDSTDTEQYNNQLASLQQLTSLPSTAKESAERNLLKSACDYHWHCLVNSITDKILLEWQSETELFLWGLVNRVLDSISVKNNTSTQVQLAINLNYQHILSTIPHHIHNHLLKKINTLPLASLLKNITFDKLKNLQEGAKQFQLTIQQRKRAVANRVIAAAIPGMSKNDAHNLINQEIGKECLAYYNAIITYKLIAEPMPNRDPQKRNTLNRQDSMGIALENMWCSLSPDTELDQSKNLLILITNKTQDELESIKKQNSQENVSTPFTSVNIENSITETYNTYSDSITFNNDTTENSNARKREILDHLTAQLKKTNLINALQKTTLEQLENFRDETSEKFNEAEEAFTQACNDLAEVMALTVQTQGSIKANPLFLQNGGSTPLVATLTDQCINIMHQDETGNTIFDKAIQLADMKEIDKLYAHLKNDAILEEDLLSHTLTKLIHSNDQKGLLVLAAHGRLFDLNLVAKLRKKFSHDSQLFSELFDKENNFIINAHSLRLIDEKIFALLAKHASDAQWSQINIEIQRRYCVADAHENIQMPRLLWEIIEKKRNGEERFEKIAKIFEDAIVHTVTERKNAKHTEHYDNKTAGMLEILNEPADNEKTLQQQALAIATTCLLPTKIFAQKHTHSKLLPSRPSATQQILIKKYVQLKKDEENDKEILAQEAPLQSAEPETNVSISKATLEKVLTKTAGDIEEQKKKHKRAIIARAMFKETLEHLRKPRDQHPEKLTLLENLIEQYINGSYTAEEFTRELKNQISQRVGDDQKTTDARINELGSSVKSYCFFKADFGKNTTSKLITKALQHGGHLLRTYGAVRAG